MPTGAKGNNISPGLAAGLGLGGAVAGALPDGPTVSNGTQTTNQSGQTSGNTNTFNSENFTTWLANLINSSSNQQSATTTSYNLDPGTQALLAKLQQQYSSAAQPFNAQNYQASQIQGINHNADLAQQSAANTMAARGVSGPAAATTSANIDNSRFGAINNMQMQLPFTQNSYNMGNLGQAAQFLSFIPKSTTTTGQQTADTTQSSNQQGNNTMTQAGGSTNYAQSDSSGTTTTHNDAQKKGSLAGAVGGGVGVLASLFSDARLKKEIQEIPSEKAVKNIMALRPTTWRWTKDESSDMGVIAQDLKKVLPELVHKDPSGSGFDKVNYAGLISQLVGAVQAIAKDRVAA